MMDKCPNLIGAHKEYCEHFDEILLTPLVQVSPARHLLCKQPRHSATAAAAAAAD